MSADVKAIVDSGEPPYEVSHVTRNLPGRLAIERDPADQAGDDGHFSDHHSPTCDGRRPEPDASLVLVATERHPRRENARRLQPIKDAFSVGETSSVHQHDVGLSEVCRV
jgi:hypothetical protein